MLCVESYIKCKDVRDIKMHHIHTGLIHQSSKARGQDDFFLTEDAFI